MVSLFCASTAGTVTLLTTLFHSALWFPVPSKSELAFKEIVENVRRNEALYDDIEVSLHQSYQSKHATFSFSDGRQEITGEQKRIRHVTQKGMFRLERLGTNTVGVEAKQMTSDRVRAFDGKSTRSFDQRARGNIVAGRSEDAEFVRPHMMLLRQPRWLHVPLSTFMEGHTAMAAHPNIQWEPELIMENTYQGEVEFQGMKCHKIWLTTINKSKATANDRWELWLAEERNYIPVRMFGYLFGWSKEIPVGEGTVNEIREIAPGIWFPYATRVVRYDDIVIQRENRQQESWREEHVVEEVSLDPKYDIEFFRNVDFPDGTAVYEVEDRKIVRSYVQGSPEAPGGPAGGSISRRWWFLWANAAIVVVIAGLLVARKLYSTSR